MEVIRVAVPDMGAPGQGGLWLCSSPCCGRRAPPRGLYPLAMAALPKGARPGHSCGCEPSICPNNTSHGAVCARAGQHHAKVRGGWCRLLFLGQQESGLATWAEQPRSVPMVPGPGHWLGWFGSADVPFPALPHHRALPRWWQLPLPPPCPPG